MSENAQAVESRLRPKVQAKRTAVESGEFILKDEFTDDNGPKPITPDDGSVVTPETDVQEEEEP